MMGAKKVKTHYPTIPNARPNVNRFLLPGKRNRFQESVWRMPYGPAHIIVPSMVSPLPSPPGCDTQGRWRSLNPYRFRPRLPWEAGGKRCVIAIMPARRRSLAANPSTAQSPSAPFSSPTPPSRTSFSSTGGTRHEFLAGHLRSGRDGDIRR